MRSDIHSPCKFAAIAGASTLILTACAFAHVPATSDNRLDGNGVSTFCAYDEMKGLVARDAFHHEEHEGHEGFTYDAVGNLRTASTAIAQEAFTYDLMDRLSSAATVVSNATFATTYARDLGGLVTNLVYAPGKTLTRAYDPDGRLASVSDWLGHTWTFAHDGAGKPTGGTAPSGIASTNHYDAAGRLAAWSVGTLAGRTITRDAAGLKTRDDITTGPLPAPHNVRYADNTFDAADRLTTAAVRYGSHTNATIAETYHYDGNGALTNLVSGSNAVFAATYNPLGQVSSLRFFATNNLPPAAILVLVHLLVHSNLSPISSHLCVLWCAKQSLAELAN